MKFPGKATKFIIRDNIAAKYLVEGPAGFHFATFANATLYTSQAEAEAAAARAGGDTSIIGMSTLHPAYRKA